jgi:hypothetical protein
MPPKAKSDNHSTIPEGRIEWASLGRILAGRMFPRVEMLGMLRNLIVPERVRRDALLTTEGERGWFD